MRQEGPWQKYDQCSQSPLEPLQLLSHPDEEQAPGSYRSPDLHYYQYPVMHHQLQDFTLGQHENNTKLVECKALKQRILKVDKVLRRRRTLKKKETALKKQIAAQMKQYTKLKYSLSQTKARLNRRKMNQHPKDEVYHVRVRKNPQFIKKEQRTV